MCLLIGLPAWGAGAARLRSRSACTPAAACRARRTGCQAATLLRWCCPRGRCFSPHHASTGCARGSQCTGVLVHCARVRAGLVHGSSLRRTINPAPLLLCRKGILDKHIRRPAHLQFLNLEISKFRSERNVPSEICRVLAARESARETTFRRQRERATLSLAPSFALFRALALALAIIINNDE